MSKPIEAYVYTATDVDKIMRDIPMEILEKAYTTYYAFGDEPVTAYLNECPKCHTKKQSRTRYMMGNYCSNCGQKLVYKNEWPRP